MLVGGNSVRCNRMLDQSYSLRPARYSDSSERGCPGRTCASPGRGDRSLDLRKRLGAPFVLAEPPRYDKGWSLMRARETNGMGD